jgi:hypothetical protein
MKSYVFWSNRHAPMVLASKTLRGYCHIELTEEEARGLSPEEREEVRVAKERRELFVHPFVDGRPATPVTDTVIGAGGRE